MKKLMLDLLSAMLLVVIFICFIALAFKLPKIIQGPDKPKIIATQKRPSPQFAIEESFVMNECGISKDESFDVAMESIALCISYRNEVILGFRKGIAWGLIK